MPNYEVKRGEHFSEMLSVDDAKFNEELTLANAISDTKEIGATGLKRAAGEIDEEFLPALRGRKAVKVYREMALNDPVVAALLFSIEQLLRQVEWTVVTPDNTPDSKAAGEFVEQCMEDMSHTWDDMIAEILSFLTYGWSWHEIVYKKRIGPWERDPARRSKYTDGKIGWRKIPIRSQETLLRWMFDEDGGVQAMVQMPPPRYKMTTVPINRSLLFRPKLSKNNPEGMSMLRGAYRPWFYKKRLEEIEAIGVERDLAGMPVAWVPSDYMKAQPGTEKQKTYLAFKKMVQNVRRDAHEGLVLPNEYDSETKQKLFEFELLSSGGGRTFDTNAIIQRYAQLILQTVLADFIMLGHEGTGSYAMHVDKTGIFRAALNSIAASIANVFNRYAIPRLFELNGWKPAELPQIKPSNVDPPNLTELSSFMTSMSGLGMTFFPDPDLEKYLRDTAHLPELPEEIMELRRQMAQQQNIMQFAEQRMMAQGTAQKDEMVQQGMSPEQAELASQSPTPEMAAQEQVAAYQGQAIADQDPHVKAKKDEELTQEAEVAEAQEGNKFAREGAKAEQQFALDQAKEKSKFDLDEKRAERGAKRDEDKAKKDFRRQTQLERIKAAQQKKPGKLTPRKKV